MNNDKANYNHVFILEERAKRVIRTNIIENKVKNFDSNIIYFDQDYIYFSYELNQNNQWIVEIKIHHQSINEYAVIYYTKETDELIFENQ